MAQQTPVSERLFPSTKPHEPVAIPLSIADSTCGRYENTGAIWVFHPSANGPPVQQLKSSLISTLALFPHLAGQFQFVQYKANGKHTERFGRLMISYGNDTDPGVEWTVVQHDFTAASMVPDPETVSAGPWSVDSFPDAKLMPAGPLALADVKTYEGLPCMQVQLNLLACGGYAVAARTNHSIADAQALVVFVHEWAARCRSEVGSPSASPFGQPVFDPAALDVHAAGDVDGASPDQSIIDKARALPLKRYDVWDTDAEGYFPFMIDLAKNSMPPPEIMKDTVLSPAEPVPWKRLNILRPPTRALVHFTGQQLSELKERALKEVDETSELSRLDVLLAQLFILITRARTYQQDPNDEVNLNVTMDLRRRVSPPLPDTSMGSPTLLPHVTDKASAVRSSSIGQIATKLRQTYKTFTPDAVAAYLHDSAFEVSPLRLLQNFVGTHDVTVTSWQRLKLYEVDFEGAGRRPALAHYPGQPADGLLVVLDPLAADGGVDVLFGLDAETMPRFTDELKAAGLLS